MHYIFKPHCASKIVPSIEERKEKKRKKNDPKVEEDSISRQIFRMAAAALRHRGGAVCEGLVCAHSAALMHFPAIFHSN